MAILTKTAGSFPNVIRLSLDGPARVHTVQSKCTTISIGDEFYHPMPTIRRRIEVIAFEQERIVRRAVPGSLTCPVCHLSSEMLTVRQAGVLAQVRAASIRRWLTRGQAHGVRTGGGHHRICSNSLFTVGKPNPDDSRGLTTREPVEKTTIARVNTGVSTGSDSDRVALHNQRVI